MVVRRNGRWLELQDSEATFVRLPRVERVPSFTIELVDQWIADVNTIEHVGGTAPREAGTARLIKRHKLNNSMLETIQ